MRRRARWPVGGRRLPGSGWLLVVASLSASVVLGPSAGADDLTEARVAAREAATQVDALQRQVDVARAGYQAALDGLAGAVTRSVQADRTAMAAVTAARRAESERARTVRALYASGGSLALFSGLLSAASPAELASRWAVSDRLLAVAADRVTVADIERSRAESEAAARRGAAVRRIATVQDVEAAYARLDLLLQRQQTILDRLDARARALAEAQAAADRLAAERAAAAQAALTSAGQVTAAGIPAGYERLYRAAAVTCPGLSWTVLAAIGQVESGHGRNVGPSSAGAMGPMQFLPSTFAGYAVDGDGDGDRDIWDPADSVFSAARYLCANGAGIGPRALYHAIWRYNHADWYVLMVMRVAAQVAQRSGEPVPVAIAP